MHPLITSLQNPKIKHVLSLDKARERKQQGLCIIEGVKEITLAVKGGYELETVFFCPTITSADFLFPIIKRENLLIPVQENIFQKIAYRETTGGVVAIAKQRQHSMTDIRLSNNPLILIAESVEKPGNLGALLRTADAANLDAVIICDPQTDFYNPNVIRSSLGCVFTQQLASTTSEAAIEWLITNNIKVYCTHLQASRPYYETDFTVPSAIVMGTESTGLSDIWTDHSSANIIIPMEGEIDSINVSTAAAVVIFEAKRQRKLH